QCGVHRIPAPGGRPLPDAGPHSHGSRQSLGAYFPRDAGLSGHRTESFRVHLHAHPRFMAEPDRILLWEDGQDLAARDTRHVESGAKTRIEMYLREVNEEPVVFRWKYKLETLSVV